MVSWSSSGPAGVPLAVLSILYAPCQSITYLFAQRSVWLLSRFILFVLSHHSATFLCEDQDRLIPVLVCNARENLIAHGQKNPWPRRGVTRPVLLGRGCGNQWQGESLISVLAAMAHLPVSLSTPYKPLRLTTSFSSPHPPAHAPDYPP